MLWMSDIYVINKVLFLMRAPVFSKDTYKMDFVSPFGTNILKLNPLLQLRIDAIF